MILLTLSSFSPASHWTLLLLVRSQATKYISSFYFSFLKLLRIYQLLLSSLTPSLLAPTRTPDTDTATTADAAAVALLLLLLSTPVCRPAQHRGSLRQARSGRDGAPGLRRGSARGHRRWSSSATTRRDRRPGRRGPAGRDQQGAGQQTKRNTLTCWDNWVLRRLPARPS